MAAAKPLHARRAVQALASLSGMVLLLVPLLSRISSGSPTLLVGDSQVESSPDSDPVGQAEAFRFTATSSGTVSDLIVYVDTPSTSQTVVAGLYADQSGHPGTLLTQGTISAPAKGAWNDAQVPAATVTSGVAYWIAALGASGGTFAFRDRCCGGGQASETSSQSNLTALPTSWTTGTVYHDGPASMYASAGSLGPPPTPGTVGQWASLMNWPLVAVHANLMRTGNVLAWDAWATPTNAQVWNPSTGTFTQVSNPSDIFCGGNVALADGRILVAGGHVPGPDAGMNETNIFDPSTSKWSRGADMNFNRWYPAVTELPDGRVLAVSGEQTLGNYADTPEVYSPATNKWTLLSTISTSQVHEPEYPLSYVLPNGKVFVLGPSTGQAFTLDPSAPSWTAMGGASTVRNGSAVMYRPGKILYTGGGNISSTGNPAQAAAAVMDTSAVSPSWRATSSMSYGRYEHELLVLPDGKVLAVGGASITSQDPSAPGALPAEMWDPATEAWTTMASMAVQRNYHTTALLMPDGRVLVAGSGKNSGDPNGPGQYNAQYFSPPYLFQGPRPTISSAPAQTTYGTSMTIPTPDAANISSVSLVALGSSTHTNDWDQNFVPLSFTAGTGSLTVQTPASAALAPPGYYMLFVVNNQGVPSVAPIVQVTSQPPAVTMTAPANGATVSGTSVPISASVTASAPISSVQFLLDGSPLGAPVTTTPYTMSWDSTATPNGNHSLSARATDTSGATGAATPVTVAVANSPPVISNAAVGGVTANTAILTWTTDTRATSQINYGTTTSYGSSTPLDPSLVTSHSQTITGLAANTSYHCVLVSSNGGGTSTSSDIAFTTSSTTTGIDVVVSRDGHGPVTTPSFNTSAPGEILVAFVGSDGPSSSKQTATVSGAGLSWSLVQRSNGQAGDAEIWQARAPNQLSNVTVTSTPGVGGYDESLTVMTIQGVTSIGAVAAKSASTGPPSISLTSTEAGSLVFAVGNDWDNAIARTPGSGQTLKHQWVDTATGDTFWTQAVTAPVSAAGLQVTVNDTAPTSDRWNLSAVEVRP
jgi:hypothetical protein